MTTPKIRAALDTFQQAANRGTAVHLSPEPVQELRDALNAEPEGPTMAEEALVALDRIQRGDASHGSDDFDLVANALGQLRRWGIPATPPAREPLNGYLQGYDAGRRDAAADAQQAADAAQNPPAPELGELVKTLTQEAGFLEAHCNKIANGECRTLACLQRGGYIRSNGPSNPSVATCPELEKAGAKRRAAALLQQQATELAALREVPVAVGEWEDVFMGGVCAALATVTAHSDSVIWREIVRSVGIDNALNYAANVSPEDWDLAGFSKYAQPQLGKDKPLPAPQAGEGEA